MLGDHSDPDKPVFGFINKLSKRVGMLARLAKVVTKEQFKSLVYGLFFSKLFYCLPLFDNTFGLDTLQDGDIRHNSFTKSNMQSLQVLQNKILRIISGHKYETPVKTLLKDTNMLSINQIVAFSTTLVTFKVRMTGQPAYLAKRLTTKEATHITRHNQ